MRLLLIEPDRFLADVIRQQFEYVGYTVLMCASAQSALFAADEFKPHCVVLELQLIGHSGIEFLYEFRSYTDWKNTPVIIHTHVPAGEFADSWELLRDNLNIAQYLYKPSSSLAELQRAVQASLPVPA